MDTTQNQMPPEKRSRGFTLIELLLSVAILAVLVLMMTSVLSNMQSVVSRSQAQVEEFEDARLAFESMARRLSQSTLNSYWGYVFDKPGTANPNPLYFSRLSDQHYVSDSAKNLLPNFTGNGHAVFFQALLGDTDSSTTMGPTIASMKDLLNCWGYYVDYGSDLTRRPAFMKTGPPLTLNPERKRFRLMEFRQPADKSILFDQTFNINGKTNRAEIYRWFRGPFAGGTGTTADYSVPLADNILCLVVIPYIYVTDEKATSTDTRKKQSVEYDTRLYQWRPGTSLDITASKHQPPAMLELTLIAADERSYQRLVDKVGESGAETQVKNVFKGLLTDGTKFAYDLNKDAGPGNVSVWEIDTITSRLNAIDLHYKIFTTTVSIKASKWITEREK